MMKIKTVLSAHNQKIHGLFSLIFLFSIVISGFFISIQGMAEGNSLLNLYLPAGIENDELGYYLQVSAMLETGTPPGYFGYNGTHANYLTFAAWGPLVLLPYYLWALLFGWHLQAPFLCNVAMIILSSGIFLRLARPNLKQITLLILFTQGFYVYNRYIFSGMIEAIYFSALWILAGTIFYLQNATHSSQEPEDQNTTVQKKNTAIFFLQIITICWLTLLRPYYAICLLFPLAYLVQNKKKKREYLWILPILLAFVVNFWISANLCSPYPIPSSFAILGDDVAQHGLFQTVLSLIFSIFSSFERILSFSSENFQRFQGSVYLIALDQIVLFFLMIVYAVRRKQLKLLLPEFLFTLISVAIILATATLYRLDPGSRGVISLILLMGIGFSMSKIPKVGVLNLILLFVFSALTLPTPLLYETPETEAMALHYTETFVEILGTADHPNLWDNTICFLHLDKLEANNSYYHTDYVPMFFLPAGFATNTHLYGPITDFDAIPCKWLVMTPYGQSEINIQAWGGQEAYRDENIVLYQLRE